VDDIDALLAEADEQMGPIRKAYAASLRAKEVAPGLQPKIKNVLENQRSALEYLAHAIVDQYGKKGTRVYFPIVATAGDFSGRFDKNMQGVATARPDIRDAIEQRQPYWSGYEWIGHLATLTNENKHQKLTPQRRAEATRLTGGPGGGTIGTQGARIGIGEGAAIMIGQGANIQFASEGPVRSHNIEQTTLVDWLFADPSISALETLETIQQQLPTLIAEIRHVAGL
jgi:hypothetical protein